MPPYEFQFGKYRSKSITAVPTAYLKFLVGNNPSFFAAVTELRRRKDLALAGNWKEPKGA